MGHFDDRRDILPGDPITARWLNDTSRVLHPNTSGDKPQYFRHFRVRVVGERTYGYPRSYHDCVFADVVGTPEEDIFRVYLLNGDVKEVDDEAIAVMDRGEGVYLFLSSSNANANGGEARPLCLSKAGTVEPTQELFNGHTLCEYYEFGPIDLVYASQLGITGLTSDYIRLSYVSPGQWLSDPLTRDGDTLYLSMVEEVDGLWVCLDSLGVEQTEPEPIEWAWTHAFPETPYVSMSELMRLSLSRTLTAYGASLPPGTCQYWLLPAWSFSTTACGDIAAPSAIEVSVTIDGSPDTIQLTLTGTACTYTSSGLGCESGTGLSAQWVNTGGVSKLRLTVIHDGGTYAYESAEIPTSGLLDELESGPLTLDPTSAHTGTSFYCDGVLYLFAEHPEITA